jgi:deoxyribodipyrimidine photo-lyase
MGSNQPEPNVLAYLMRRDLRVADNPILHHLSQQSHSFTHLLPIYVFPAKQLEVSGFLKDGEKSPYPEAKSRLGGFWRCGSRRAQFLAESVWDLKSELEKVGSGLVIRVGTHAEVIEKLVENGNPLKIGAVWMVGDVAFEEKEDEEQVKKACECSGADFKLWVDEKYLFDEYVPTLFL